jgi:hypothetical protein
VGLNSLKSLKLTNVYPNNKNKKKSKNNKVKSKPLQLYFLLRISQFFLSVSVIAENVSVYARRC